MLKKLKIGLNNEFGLRGEDVHEKCEINKNVALGCGGLVRQTFLLIFFSWCPFLLVANPHARSKALLLPSFGQAKENEHRNG